MKKLAPRLGLALVAVLAVALLGAWALPADFEVTRSVRCAAPPATIHLHLEDFHRWTGWSRALGDARRVEYTGAAKGVDARARWRGARAGGALEIRASLPERGVWIDERDGEGRDSKIAILYESLADGATHVVWKQRGAHAGGLLGRWSGLMRARALAGRIEADLEALRALFEP